MTTSTRSTSRCRRLRAALRLQLLDARRRRPAPAGFDREGLERSPASISCARSASPPADRRSQRGHLRHADGRGRATPQGRASARLRLRQSLRQERHALHPLHRPRQDDGGRPAFPLRRDLQDDQHAERSDDRRHQDAYMAGWDWRSKRWRSIATVRSSASRSPPSPTPRRKRKKSKRAVAEAAAAARTSQRPC